MKNVTVETKLTIKLTANEWQLYGKPGRDIAAAEINEQIMKYLHATQDPQEAYQLCESVLSKYDAFGATDSEPMWVLGKLLKLRFPGQ